MKIYLNTQSGDFHDPANQHPEPASSRAETPVPGRESQQAEAKNGVSLGCWQA
jgi:hypothetical protein